MLRKLFTNKTKLATMRAAQKELQSRYNTPYGKLSNDYISTLRPERTVVRWTMWIVHSVMQKKIDRVDVQFEAAIQNMVLGDLMHRAGIEAIGKSAQGAVAQSAEEGLSLGKYALYKFLKWLAWRIIMRSRFYRNLETDVRNHQREAELKDIRQRFTFFMRMYNLSIENIVEGQREVTFNQNYKFEDGKTVKEKMDAFERLVRIVMNKMSGPKK
jgi:hypothetical protein